MAVIELTQLSKWYGEVIGLNNVTAEIEHGITGLLGPNGAGKSTLMGLATGQLRPSKGGIRVFGESPWDNPSVISRIGYCPEGDPFWQKLTGFQFVVFLARMSGLQGASARRAAIDAIERTGMSANAGRAIRGYSKGMRQRIKIAQALVHSPELLILDEPFTGADPIARHELTNLFRELAAQGVHILVSSHVLHEVEAMTREMLMIDHGRIVAQGDVQAVRKSLLDRPHVIRVRVDQSRKLASQLVGWELVSGVSIPQPDTVLFETKSPEAAYERLNSTILSDGMNVQEIAAADESLEAVFGYLTHRESK
ncbi:MAG: ABC transporter ATP-binding protein [Planctomycetes bacterium]|nr:ABC transporter ATP-binding protein [Planctomycetota bacterium]MBI3835237.1 ABC transporter ATP-binding protein [Planctomycetota bacterium]